MSVLAGLLIQELIQAFLELIHLPWVGEGRVGVWVWLWWCEPLIGVGLCGWAVSPPKHLPNIGFQTEQHLNVGATHLRTVATRRSMLQHETVGRAPRARASAPMQSPTKAFYKFHALCIMLVTLHAPQEAERAPLVLPAAEQTGDRLWRLSTNLFKTLVHQGGRRLVDSSSSGCTVVATVNTAIDEQISLRPRNATTPSVSFGIQCMAPVGQKSVAGGADQRDALAPAPSPAPTPASCVMVCANCKRQSVNGWAHDCHTQTSPNPGCRNAFGIPLATWQAQRDAKAVAAAAEAERCKGFCEAAQEDFVATCGDLKYGPTERGGWLAFASHRLFHLRYLDHVPSTTVKKVGEWKHAGMVEAKEEVLRRLRYRETLPPEEQPSLESCIGDVFSVYQQLQGRTSETQYSKLVDPIVPVRRALIDTPDSDGQATGPRRGDHVYDVPLISRGAGDALERGTLQALVDSDPSLVPQLRELMAQWATQQPNAGDSVRVYVDLADGSIMRNHPELGVSADQSDGAVRLAFILYYDDVEVVNALGAFTGVHKLGLFYWALVNLPPDERMSLNNIHLATVALESDIRYYGIDQIVSGPPFEPDTGSSIGASLRALDAGISLNVDSRGKTIPTLFRGWLLTVAADFPAAGLLTGAMCGATAHRFCRECEIDTRNPDYREPNSFIDDDAPSAYALRTMDSHAELERRCAGLDPKARKREMSSCGWRSFAHAFVRIPKFDICTQVPEDVCASLAVLFVCQCASLHSSLFLLRFPADAC
jgi:hypothetical protein